MCRKVLIREKLGTAIIAARLFLVAFGQERLTRLMEAVCYAIPVLGFVCIVVNIANSIIINVCVLLLHLFKVFLFLLILVNKMLWCMQKDLEPFRHGKLGEASNLYTSFMINLFFIFLTSHKVSFYTDFSNGLGAL